MKKYTAAILLLIAFILFVQIVLIIIPVHDNGNPPHSYGWGVDWKGTIRTGALELLSGRTPYTRVTRCLPPWIYILVSPLAILPVGLSTAIMFVLSYLVYSFVLFRLKANPWVIAAFVLNSFAFLNAKNGNLDFLAAFGFILPPQIGLFFVLSKPQIGAGIAIYWLVQAWRTGKAREVIRVFAPVGLAYLASFIIFGFWPLLVSGMTNDRFNMSLFPVGIIVAVIMLAKSIRDKNPLYAMGSGPFLAPYVNKTSFAVTLFPFIPYPVLLLIVTALSWR